MPRHHQTRHTVVVWVVVVLAAGLLVEEVNGWQLRQAPSAREGEPEQMVQCRSRPALWHNGGLVRTGKT